MRTPSSQLQPWTFEGIGPQDISAFKMAAQEFRNRELYVDFADLSAHHEEGVDFVRSIKDRSSQICVVAPHGGNLEFGTAEIARELSGEDLSCYIFECFQAKGNSMLHLTSTKFDDPQCLQIVSASQSVVSIHGCKGDYEAVYVGGRDEKLRDELISTLNFLKIPAAQDQVFPGKNQRNICNRGRKGEGIQLEFTAGMRRSILSAIKEKDLKNRRIGVRVIDIIRRVLLRN